MTGSVSSDLRLWLAPAARGVTTKILVGRGVRSRLPALLDTSAPAPAYAVVSDDHVADLYGEPLRDALRERGRVAELFRFPAGEASKTPARWAELVEGFGAMELGRDGCVVAVGGGVTGDLAGFAAATYARGVTLVQVPTSLLAMIDAALGGKTGVDLAAGKNLAGAFHDPALVAVDPGLLDTLPEEELRRGLAEAVKHGAIADAEYLADLRQSADAILSRHPGAIDRVVSGSVRIKIAVVERDARESGERAILNFGHTIAHAVERVSGYAVSHGEAVAMGMVVEATIGERAGVTRPGTADAIRLPLRALGLPTTIPATVDRAELREATRSDKKTVNRQVRYALIESVGVPARTGDGGWTRVVADGAVEEGLNVAAPASTHRHEV